MSTAAIYTRISIDKTDDGVAVERQERECRALAKRLGLEVSKVYVDNDISATKGKARPDFEQMLLAAPPVIIAWHQDRLLRKGTDLERVIALNVPVHTVQSGLLDLTNPAGRAVARTVAAWSQYEGEQKAVRQLSKNSQLVETGLPVPGRRRYGFEKGNVTLRPDEAMDVARMFADFLAGSSIRSLSIARGWRPLRVRETLANPAYAGYVVRKGERFEAHESVARIISREDFEKVQAVLNAPGRKTTPGSAPKHLLSGLATCGICDRPLVYRNNYLCTHDLSHPCVEKSIMETKIKAEVIDALMWKRDRDYAPADDRLQAIDRRASDLAQQELQLLDSVRYGVKMSTLGPQLRALHSELAQLEEERVRILAADVQGSLLANLRAELVDDSRRVSIEKAGKLRRVLRERFEALSFDRQRELIRGLLDIKLHPGRGADRIVVTPL